MNPPHASQPSQSLTIALLGPLDVRVDGTPVSSWHTRKGQWLLALLALKPQRPVERAWLADTLWPESTQSQAAANLRLSLSQLRRTLGNAAHRIQTPTSHTLCLDLAGTEVDLFAFDAVIARGDAASLEAALALYRGALLEGCHEEWVLPERRAREHAYLMALETLASHAATQGDSAKAAGYLQRVVAADALRESAHRSLMQALATAGDYAAAKQVYQNLRILLHREMNALPAAETEALHAQLQKLARRLAVLPPLPPLDPSLPPRRLPTPLTRLIGREQEVTDVVGWLGVGRLVTLTGAGGVGKTRLAIAAAEAVWREYPDGVWFVELASISEPMLVTHTVASALGIKEQPQRSILETLIDALTPRSLLLVLDNCEHLLEACADLLHHLLTACPSLRVLTTSRQLLGLTGERVYRAPSLALPAAGGTTAEKEVASLLEYAAVELFVERAVLAHPGFRLTRRNVGAVSQICRRLDGIALALELAAARVRSLTVEEIDTRLKVCFDLLSGGGRAALPRHRTLHASIDWSYSLLSGPERTLLRRLSVFTGGWTLEAAEQVCSDSGDATSTIQSESVLNLLTGLVDQSLAIAETHDGTTRYRLLEAIRQYAAQRLLEHGDRVETHRRHVRFFVQFAKAAEAERASGHVVWSDWVDHLEAEHDNLRAALDYCLVDEQQAGVGLQLAEALAYFWRSCNYEREGRARLEAALAHRGDAPVRVQAQALSHVGWIALFAGDAEIAQRHFEECLAIVKPLQDRALEAHALGSVGAALRDRSEWDAARPYFEAGRALFQELGDQGGVEWMLRCLGHVAHFQGDFASARTLYTEAIVIGTERGTIALTQRMLGRLCCEIGDYPAASAHYVESLHVSEDAADRIGVAICIDEFAALARACGQWQRGARLFGAAHALRQPLDKSVLPLDRAYVEENLSAVRAALGDKAFATEWADGLAMTLEQAIQYALAPVPADKSSH